MSDNATMGGLDDSSGLIAPTRRPSVLSVFSRMFSSLRHRNYRLFFTGQIISLFGNWLQTPALQWLVWTLTGSKVQLGVLQLMMALPAALLSLPGGAVADRLDRRRILIVTQSLLVLGPLAVAILMIAQPQHVRVWHLFVMAALNGIIMSFDMPARQAFVVQMVGRADLPNAIGLNSSVFNIARALGPAIGGVLLIKAGAVLAFFGVASKYAGAATCFGANGASYLALVAALLMMRMPVVSPRRRKAARAGHPAGGLFYVWSTPALRAAFMMLAANSVLAWSFMAMLPAFTTEVFHRHAGTFSTFLTTFGAGALLGALVLAYRGSTQTLRKTVLAGVALFICGAVLFTLLDHYLLALIPLFFAGTGIMNCNAGLNSYVQMFVNERFRGRVMGIYALFFIGMMPVGSLLVGWLAEALSLPPLGLDKALALRLAVLTALGLLAASSLAVGLYWRKVKDEDRTAAVRTGRS